MDTIITTGGRPDKLSIKLASEASSVLGYPVIERNKKSIAQLQKEFASSVLVAGKDRFDLYCSGMDKPFFFHPNSAAYRLKRLLNGEKDPFIDSTQLQANESLLDCTLGLASDSIIASFITGEKGLVVGVEADQDVAFITQRGLHSFPTESRVLKEAMSRITVVQSDAVSYLREQEDHSWDVIYIDPMFSSPIEESSNFTSLRQVGVHSALSEEWIEHAIRVCRRRVVVKDRFNSPIFEEFGIERVVRPNTKFHFGFIRK